MSAFAAHPGIVFLVVCFVAALGLIATGAMRLVRSALALRARVGTYADLPIRQDVARAEARVAVAERRAATIPLLTARVRAAVAELQAARARLGLIVATLNAGVRFLRSFLSPS